MTDAHSETLTLDVQSGPATTTVIVAGEIDVHTSRQLDEAMERLAEDGVAAVVLDMAGVGFIDSSGLRSLLTAQRAFEAAGTVFGLRNLSAAMLRLLEVTGLLTSFSIAD
ncbi:MAG: STAS domain-containing protein [Acidimicrobiia bacterium]